MAEKELAEIDELEGQLFARLKPIQPRTEFVDHLKYRLENSPTTTVERPSWGKGILILVSGLLGGFLLYGIIRKIARMSRR